MGPFLDLRLPSGESCRARHQAESDPALPERVGFVDDRINAEQALRRLEAPEALIHLGDYHQARQLVAALKTRIARSLGPAPSAPAQAYAAERQRRHREHALLGRLLVLLHPGYQPALARAPDAAQACEQVWGPSPQSTVVALTTLQGILGAAEWRRKGLVVPGLKGRLHPHYGVYSPTRHEYLNLMNAAPAPTGKTVFDVGTGTGILSLMLLQRGARCAVATDLDERAVDCAKENAQRLGLTERLRVEQRDLYPSGTADLIVSNPPWIPEPPRTRFDRAVFDPDSAFLTRLLQGAREHLSPGGELLLLISNLAELLELRPAGFLRQTWEASGLALRWKRSTPPLHPKSQNRADPLHAVRSLEMTTLYCLGVSRS